MISNGASAQGPGGGFFSSVFAPSHASYEAYAPSYQSRPTWQYMQPSPYMETSPFNPGRHIGAQPYGFADFPAGAPSNASKRNKARSAKGGTIGNRLPTVWRRTTARTDRFAFVSATASFFPPAYPQARATPRARRPPAPGCAPMRRSRCITSRADRTRSRTRFPPRANPTPPSRSLCATARRRTTPAAATARSSARSVRCTTRLCARATR